MELLAWPSPLASARKDALPRIEGGAGELPVRVTRVAFLMGNKSARDIFAGDGLEARRAD